MKKLVLGLVTSVAVSAMTLGVSAQQARAEHAATHDWTGPYIGAIVGIGSLDASAQYTVPFASEPLPVNVPLSDSGFLGGLTVGWNAQSGHMVYGIEGDVSFGDFGTTVPVFNGTPTDLGVQTDLFATIRGRVGVASNDIFLYGTAGLAILDGDITGSVRLDESKGFTELGAVLGAGAELAITEDVTVKAELLYAIFDTSIGIGDLFGFNPGDSVKLDNFYTVRVGVNWHF